MKHHLRHPHQLRRLAAVIGAVCLLGVSAAGLADAHSGAEPQRRDPRPIIVEVTGDAANGFGITYADGASIYPPTDSEARAECGEYDQQIARVRCRVETRTWYRDLGDLKRSLAWVRTHE